MLTLLIIVLLVVALGSLPSWPYSSGWGYYPSGGAGLVLIIFALTRTGHTRYAPAAVGAYIGAAYIFTSSTSFANPAITIGRMFSDTFAGIARSSAPGYIAAQLIGGAVGFVVVRLFYADLGPAEASRSRT